MIPKDMYQTRKSTVSRGHQAASGGPYSVSAGSSVCRVNLRFWKQMSVQRVETEPPKPVTLDNRDETFSRFVRRGQVIHINNEASVFAEWKGGNSFLKICHFIPQRRSGSLKMQRTATGQHWLRAVSFNPALRVSSESSTFDRGHQRFGNVREKTAVC